MADAPLIPPSQSFTTIEADSFGKVMEMRIAKFNRSDGGAKGQNIARRPYMGIDLKGERPTTISIVDANGTTIPIASPSNAGENVMPGQVENASTKVEDYSDFILNQVTEQRSEKSQIVDTFGDPYIFFYGEQPRTVTFSGLLINSLDFNWRSQFWFNYDNYLRGTKLVQLNARAYISWDTIVLEGYALSAQASESADRPTEVNFSLTMFVTNYYDFSNIGSPHFGGIGGVANQGYEPPPGRLNIPSWESSGDATVNRFLKLVADIRRHGPRYWQAKALSYVDKALKLTNFTAQQGNVLIGGVLTEVNGVSEGLESIARASNESFSMFSSQLHSNWNTLEQIPLNAAAGVTSLLGVGVTGASIVNAMARRAARMPAVLDAHGDRAVLERQAALDATAAGIKKASDRLNTNDHRHVGVNATTKFSSNSSDFEARIEAGEEIQVEMGSAYDEQLAYGQDRTDAPGLEPVYGDTDYTEILETVPELSEVLRDVHGDSDPELLVEPTEYQDEPDYVDPVDSGVVVGEAGSDISPDELAEAYPSVQLSKFVQDPTIRARALEAYQSNMTVSPDEQTRSVRGVDDPYADIKPVV